MSRPDISRQAARLLDVATGKIPHLYAGLCPDSVNGPESRDPDCPACEAISAAEAKQKRLLQAKAEVESAATERANERANASWTLMCEMMVAAEREACASVRLPVTAFDFRQKILKGELNAKYDEGFLDGIKAMRAAIRARGQK